MKIGFNVLLWTTNLVEEEFHLLEKLKKVGYDGVEIPVFGGDIDHFQKIGQALKDNGLESTSVTVIPDQSHNPISDNKTDREGAVEHLKWAIGDLIRDFYLTLEAKKRKLAKSEFVKSEVITWKNYSLCKTYIKDKFSNLIVANSWLTDDIFQRNLKKMMKREIYGHQPNS